METVSQRDRDYFKKLGEFINQPCSKVTKQKKLQSFDFLEYFHFLDGARQLILNLKGFISDSPSTGTESCHQRAKKLGLIKYA